MSSLLWALDWFVLFPYIASHIPIALLVDSQLIFPASWYPEVAVQQLHWWIEFTNDFVVRDKPAFVAPFIWCEVLLQLPFCIAAIYAFLSKGNWIRIPSIVYGVHVATTTLPLVYLQTIDPQLTPEQRQLLIAVYSVYLVFPIVLATRMALDPAPFGNKDKAEAKAKKH